MSNQPTGEHSYDDGVCEVCGQSRECTPLAVKTVCNPAERANVHIEHYFPKGYDPDAEPWKSIREHHNAAERETTVDHEKATEALYTDIRQLREQLAAARATLAEIKTIMSPAAIEKLLPSDL